MPGGAVEYRPGWGHTQHPGVADRVLAGLRPVAHPVRAVADPVAVQQPAGPRAQRVDLTVVSAREPQDAAVAGEAAHVGRAATRDAPLVDRPSGAEREHADRALAAVGDE